MHKRIPICIKPEWSTGESQNSFSSFILYWFPDSHLGCAFLISCWSLALASSDFFHLLQTLLPTSVEGGLYPEDSPENWNKSFSEMIQGSIFPTTPNYTLLYSEAMVIHSHSQLYTMETSKKPGGTIWDIWDNLPRKQKTPKNTTADKTVSSLLHIERDFQNLQTPTFSFQGKSQFEKFTLFCFHFVLLFSVGWLFFLFLYNIYNGRLWFLFFSDFFLWVPVQSMNSSWHL